MPKRKTLDEIRRVSQPDLTQPSILSPKSDSAGFSRELEAQYGRDLDEVLVGRLLSESLVAEVGHLVLASIAAVLAWGLVPPVVLSVWVGTVMGSALVRGFVRRRLRLSAAPHAFSRKMARSAVIVSGLAWGAGAPIVGFNLPFEQFSLLLVIFAGLVAAGTATLASDQPSFLGFTAALLVPLAFSVPPTATVSTQTLTVVIILFYGSTMVVLHKRAHRALRRQILTGTLLELKEQQAAHDKDFLESLFSTASQAMAIVDNENQVLGINEGFERLFGWSGDGVIGRDLNDVIVAKEDRRMAAQLDREAMIAGGVVTEVQRCHKDGRKIWVRAHAASARGAAAGTMFVIYDDITEIRRAQQALKEAEQRYRVLVESASDLVWQIDVSGRWSFLNAAAENIFGTPAEHLIGQPALDRAHPDHRDDVKQLFASILEGESYADRDIVYVDGSGEAGHLSLAARAIRNADGEITGAQGTARDTSARAAAQEALRKAREDAEQAARAKTAFLANTSHELRTPLNGILGMLELLLESELDGEQSRSVDAARESAESLLAILNDILDVSKIEANRMDFVEVPFDVVETAGSAIRTVALHAFTKDLKLVLNVEPNVPAWVVGDAGRIRQILTNLLGNAVKFTEPGGEIVLKMTFSGVTPTQGLFWFVVRDTGYGIAKEDLANIFEEFVQADDSNTRRFGGAGLGLTISKRLAELLGGTLKVASEVGKGTVFTATIPMRLASSRSSADDPLPDIFREKLAVVVVGHDDERHAITHLLQALGMEVEATKDVDGGLQCIANARMAGKQAALVVLDGILPEDGANRFVEILRRDEVSAKTPIVCLLPPTVPGAEAITPPEGTEVVQKPIIRKAFKETLFRLSDADIAPEKFENRWKTENVKGKRNLYILLADDSAVNQTIAVTMLEKRGHTVDAVGNGKDAVDAVARNEYDVVLMDIQMPEMDGLAATGAIRTHPARRNLPIIALTAHAMDAERDRCIAAGMDDFLSKPFRAQELFAIVEKWGKASHSTSK